MADEDQGSLAGSKRGRRAGQCGVEQGGRG